MATPEDLKANAEYIRLADFVTEVPGGPNHSNYANVRLIVDIAESSNVDAVWAGWGHASENPQLPAALKEKNIAFIGPPAGPMQALGDKIGSSILAQSAGVPCLPWNGSDIVVDCEKLLIESDGVIPDDTYQKANIRSLAQLREASERVGYPLMIKASEGGGGKGIRKVEKPEELETAYHQVASEVPGSPIFLMALASRSRHLEVQVVADVHGNAIALYGRDCSVQRRHQKIIEEGPVYAAPPHKLREMERAAVRLAKAVGYVNAGTVEYLWLEDEKDSSKNDFAFLELNPRLQVEHPVTEWITGTNLPAIQLMVTMGIPLWAIPDIRKLYGKEDVLIDLTCPKTKKEDVVIDFSLPETEAMRRDPNGHVIAARITAENPDSGFTPTSGAVSELNFRSSPNVWAYFSIDSSGRVHEFADSQIGHVFAWGKNRELARQALICALKEISIRGDIRTTVEYLASMIEESDFRDGNFNTSWLDKRIAAQIKAPKPSPILIAIMGALWRAFLAFKERRIEAVNCLSRGQAPSPAMLSVEHSIELIYEDKKYAMSATLSGPNSITLTANNTWILTHIRPLNDGGLLVCLGNKSHLIYATEEPGGLLRLIVDGTTCVFTAEYDPACLRAPISGKLTRFLKEPGAHLAAGEPFAEVEVMKMYMPLKAPEAGVLAETCKPEGAVLEAGDLIAKVVLDDPSKVRRAEPYLGSLEDAVTFATEAVASSGSSEGSDPVTAADTRYNRRWHAVCKKAEEVLHSVLAGCRVPRDSYERAWDDRDSAYVCSDLALLEARDILSVLSSRLPSNVSSSIETILSSHEQKLKALGHANIELELTPIAACLDAHAETLTPKERTTFEALVTPLRQLKERFRVGVRGANLISLVTMLNKYLEVEAVYGEGRPAEDVVADARVAAGDDPVALEALFENCRAHALLGPRNALVLAVLKRVEEVFEMCKNGSGTAINEEEAKELFVPLLQSIADLRGSPYAAITLEARQLLVLIQQPSQKQRRTLVETLLSDMNAAEQAKDYDTRDRLFNILLDDDQPLLHVLTSFFTHESEALRSAAAEIYVRRLYRMYEIPYVKVHHVPIEDDEASLLNPNAQSSMMMIKWEFTTNEPAPSPTAASLSNPSPVRKEALSPRTVVSIGTGSANGQPGSGSGLTSRLRRGDRGIAFGTYAESSLDLASLQDTLHETGFANTLASMSEEEDAENLSLLEEKPMTPVLSIAASPSVTRVGVMACFNTLDDYKRGAPALLRLLASGSGQAPVSDALLNAPPPTPSEFLALAPKATHVLHIGLLSEIADSASVAVENTAKTTSFHSTQREEEATEKRILQTLQGAIAPFSKAMLTLGVRRITFNVPSYKDYSCTPYTPGGSASDTRVAHSGSLHPYYDRAVRNLHASLNPVPGQSASASSLPLKGRVRAGTLGSFTSLQPHQPSLLRNGFPWVYTFRAILAYSEDTIVRHIEPPASAFLELRRLSSLKVRAVPTHNRIVHVYEAQPKDGAVKPNERRTRFFARAIIRQATRLDLSSRAAFEEFPGPERMFVECLDALDIAAGDLLNIVNSPVGSNHIFLNMQPIVRGVEPAYIESAINVLAKKYADRLRRLRVSQVEFRVTLQLPQGGPLVPVRLISSNPTGYVLRVDTYVESRRAGSSGAVFCTLTPAASGPSGMAEAAAIASGEHVQHAPLIKGELDGLPITTPYPSTAPFERQRAQAAAISDTIYCYDFPALLARALEIEWNRYYKVRNLVKTPSIASPLLKCEELVLRRKPHVLVDTENPEDYELEVTNRPPGNNTIGMVAWHLVLSTPEYPDGRELIVIANDITHRAGSFGTAEDKLFLLASEYARKKGIPRLFLAANSGARIGLAEELKNLYKACWINPEEPEKGYKYLYIDDVDYQRLQQVAKETNTELPMLANPVEDPVTKTTHWVLDSIIGREKDLGVECLKGSAAIAGETSRAYTSSFTLTYCTGRSVGIGAYLIRLGQRCIQKTSNAPIILTGFDALNKLMGKKVYTSNDQLGGPRIMYTNGISHEVVHNDLEGAISILRWLAFVPKTKGDPSPVIAPPSVDTLTRTVDLAPCEENSAPYDPRLLLTGATTPLPEGLTHTLNEDVPVGTHIAGLFDRGTFRESLAGWAKSVIVGRARLAGMPVGVVIPELRTTKAVSPADPASITSNEDIVPQAGQVWFPDSAYKTAQALRDFAGEDLPVLIIANWRGFSGGQRDMFDSVLKYGSMIVDALVETKQPVLVYIPPKGELRGGAWVVVDPSINPECMEMFADPTSRGGILEPSGVVAVKYKAKELIATAHRLDPKLQQLNKELANAGDDTAAADLIKRAIASREDMLMNTVRQIAEGFADLHDTPGRMVAKKVITGTIAWKHARERLVHRFQRRIAENRICQRIEEIVGRAPAFVATGKGGAHGDVSPKDRLRAWFEAHVPCGDWSNDAAVCAFLIGEKGTAVLEKELAALRQTHMQKKIVELGSSDPDACLDAVMSLLDTLSPEKRAALQSKLYGGLQPHSATAAAPPNSLSLEIGNKTPLVSFVKPFDADTSNGDTGNVSPLYF